MLEEERGGIEEDKICGAASDRGVFGYKNIRVCERNWEGPHYLGVILICGPLSEC